MKIAIMQPYFFPYIGYWQLINAVDKFVVYDDVNYIKGGWINRNRILINKEARYFNIQLIGASPNKLIKDIGKDNDSRSSKKLLRSIEQAYSRAPYFANAYPMFKKTILSDEIDLTSFLTMSINRVCDYLGIETEIILSSNVKKAPDLRGQEKVIEICKKLGATTYINPIGGRELYDQDNFKDDNIDLKFIETGDISYKQNGDVFIPNLSILDVMMHNSVDEIKKMLINYKLV